MTDSTTQSITGYAIYGSTVGYYANNQPQWEFSFTHEISKAKVWKTIRFDHELAVILDKYDSNVQIVKITVTTNTQLDSSYFSEEYDEWKSLKAQWDVDCDAMSNRDFKRFTILNKIIKIMDTGK